MRRSNAERACKMADVIIKKTASLRRLVERMRKNAPTVVRWVADDALENIVRNPEKAVTLLAMLREWDETLTDTELVARIVNAIRTVREDKDTYLEYVALPNHWVLAVNQLLDGSVRILLGDIPGSFMEPLKSAYIGRDEVELGYVRRTGVNAPRPMAIKALQYAKKHPEN